MDFRQANEEFKHLKAQFEAGQLTEAEFKARLPALMVQDEQGAWWMIGYETERWYRHDGTTWVQADPPGGVPAQPGPVTPPPPDKAESKLSEAPAGTRILPKPAERPAKRPVVPIGIAVLAVLLIGGYFILNSMQPGARPAATPTVGTDMAIVDKPAISSTPTPTSAIPPSRTPAPTLPASSTPEPSLTPEPELHVYAAGKLIGMYEGPDIKFTQVRSYAKGEEFTVIARHPNGFWLLVRASDGRQGWVYVEWVDADFDLMIVPTATFVPALPAPTQKPKDKSTACPFGC